LMGNAGPISIGGGRFSQGGQTACDGALFLDMRELNRIVAIDENARTIVAEAGVTWRQMMEAVDPLGLAPKIMQSFFNFTLGGSLSVNCHGDYVGLGSIVDSVRAIRLVMADGAVQTASRSENPELFAAAIGGYGAVGVIVEATLDLAENSKVERVTHLMSVTEYRAWHRANVLGRPDAILHHAVIYPGAYTDIAAELCTRTDKPLAVQSRLAPVGAPSDFDRFILDIVTFTPIGGSVHEHLYDPLTAGQTEVAWRNYEAARDAYSLEPRSRAEITYALQEYFVPVERFEAFTAKMGHILRAHSANILNVAIRHAPADQETLLAWAKSESFSFVLYYAQETHEAAKAAVGAWTRELVDAAVGEGGSFYLPYQIHATRDQFLAAYPRAPEFFTAKRRFDPNDKFRNRLWQAYAL
ncbi:MAG TPA: FAD-binding oxidoreductase, partial [Verrucomicrobiae bacterium]|nr:FAD-binding oxidoreductase [Verrucomicrobiae bacterium]